MDDNAYAAAAGVLSALAAGAVYTCAAGSRRGLKDEAAPGKKKVSLRFNGEQLTVESEDGKDEDFCKSLRATYGVAPQQTMTLSRKDGTKVCMQHDSLVHGEELTFEKDSREWVELSNRLRKDGNTKFLQGNSNWNKTKTKEAYIRALELYREAYAVVPADGGEEAVSMLCLAKSNCAQICLRVEAWEDARAICTEVLSLDPNNVKALYRRGAATRKLNPTDAQCLKSALADLDRAVRASAASGLDEHVRTEYSQVCSHH
ncbi:hypothetical protein DIPPA_29061 [Diplonema papillatum]|nr:hypothetical protein DIPPA_29061 [Diplonema papillatum]